MLTSMVIILGFLALIIPIIALVDILNSQFEPNNKLIWVIIVIFTSPLGAILYFIIGRKQKIEK